MKVTIVDYGIGNILSVQRAFEHVGAQVSFANNAQDIRKADRLVVPGVGAFKNCMDAIESLKIKRALIDFAHTDKPYLGICVGMQMLLDKSYEFGEHNGLGVIAGEVKKIDVPGQRIPFIGWKEVSINNGLNKFYFVHSYQAFTDHAENLLATYNLGEQKVAAAIKKNNVIGLQFHPEKSADSGLELIQDFLKI
jgi:glutamine amidotransferase